MLHGTRPKTFGEPAVWQIDATCQIVEVLDRDTVKLDGAYVATIDWTCLDPVRLISPTSSGAFYLQGGQTLGIPLFVVMALWVYIITQASLSATSSYRVPLVLIIFPASLVGVAVLATFAISWVVVRHPANAQDMHPRFLGIEGHVSSGLVERYPFGSSRGRLVEVSSVSSPRYQDTPATDSTHSDQMEIGFTVVDTYTMTITRFTAARLPVAVIICGKDREMQRAPCCVHLTGRLTHSPGRRLCVSRPPSCIGRIVSKVSASHLQVRPHHWSLIRVLRQQDLLEAMPWSSQKPHGQTWLTIGSPPIKLTGSFSHRWQ